MKCTEKTELQMGGGVFLAVKTGISTVNRHEFDSEAELCWVSLESAGNGSLYIVSYYRPPNATRAALDNLQTSLDKMIARHPRLPNIVLAGDCNFPDIDWESVNNHKRQDPG